MSSHASSFVATLEGTIRARKSFGRHPLWQRLLEGALERSAVQTFAAQFFLQVREFPRAVSALHARCTDPQERVELAESLYEEETGRLSGCNVSHPELFIRFGEGLGMERRQLVEAEPLAPTRALVHWFELCTQARPFLEGAAAINVASEGQVPGAFGPLARSLEKHYGLSRKEVAFWDIHEQADAEHSDVGGNIVVHHATTPEVQGRVLDALRESLGMWWHFFGGIERAIDGH